jgi:hypothetical protein
MISIATAMGGLGGLNTYSPSVLLDCCWREGPIGLSPTPTSVVSVSGKAGRTQDILVEIGYFEIARLCDRKRFKKRFSRRLECPISPPTTA